nr:MAG: hypothetical protein CM15mP61_10290 [Gammaproteobacteria bacterium]
MNSIRRLPVICGYGGINSAGRSSSDLAYKRLVFDLLSEDMKMKLSKTSATLQITKQTKRILRIKP